MPLLAAAFRALDATGARWCLLRGESEVGRPGGEVDVLVEERGVDALAGSLAGAGFAPLPRTGYGSHHFFVAYDEREGTWLKLDVVSRLEFGRFHELRLGADPGCLERRREANGVWTLDPADAFWALVLHRLLDDGSIDDAHMRRIASLADEGAITAPLAGAMAGMWPPGWDATRVVAAARADDRRALLALAPALKDRWARREGIRGKFRAARTAVARRAGRLPGARKRWGFRVALLAPDGAGKSTLAASLAASFSLPAASYYMGLYPAGARRRSLPGAGLAGRILRQWRGYAAGAVQASRGRVVVFDRYCTDALLPGASSRPDRLRRWILGHACPQPDLTVVLDAPAPVLFERAGAHGVDELERRRRGYLSLAARMPRTVVVDADRSAEAVRREVAGIVWRTLCARLGRR